MAFEVIPAVDVFGGRLARMGPAGPVPVEAFGGDPLAAARAFVEAGARWIHVVDLDLAFSGSARNLDVVRAIAGLGAHVQASGAIATAAEVEAALAAGAFRAVLGSGALADPGAAGELISSMGEALVVGIETEGGLIRPRGRRASALSLEGTLEWLTELPVTRYLSTALGRVGELEGPDLDGVRALATTTGRPVIASGGIRGSHDVRALSALGSGIEGAVVGRALYEGLDLRDLLAAAR